MEPCAVTVDLRRHEAEQAEAERIAERLKQFKEEAWREIPNDYGDSLILESVGEYPDLEPVFRAYLNTEDDAELGRQFRKVVDAYRWSLAVQEAEKRDAEDLTQHR